jgi:hypothetical protein
VAKRKKEDETDKKESPDKALLTRVRERYKVLVENTMKLEPSRWPR